ncbi:hypothetical protein DEO72_LG6g1443 [Vigna unguiculata]|uniref:Uncharacterized protein n=1 Tax=Vigna unguiculata TaxID=3917 RepID=A0A4D6MA82_VIGUN|nr:hypothetical protein DEO72_LG6g1443 [Vigna unguiculata]
MSQVHLRALTQAENSCLSEATSRSGERGSPKGDRVETMTCHCIFSPGEGGFRFWARDGLV